MNLQTTRDLGSTGLKVGRLGIGAGYGAPAAALEEAFDRGCNYFWWTSRRAGMRQAIRNICRRGQRDQLVIAVHSYARSAWLMEVFYHRALKALGVDHAEVLILGWHNRPPAPRLVDKARELQSKGYVRFLGLSGHNRRLFPDLARGKTFDLFHMRYNAAHRGAETEAFPHLDGTAPPGIVTYTATRWGQLLTTKRMPSGVRTPTATDCYRFVLAHPAVDVCMCGPRNMAELQTALQVLTAPEMSSEELEWMRQVGDHVHATARKFW